MQNNATNTAPGSVIDNLGQLTLHLSSRTKQRVWPPMGRVLMVTPDHFRVEYAINPYMKTESGELQKVDLEKARREWCGLREAYESIGFRVETLPGDRRLPDMVFAANQSMPFWSPDERPAVLLSRMRAPERRPEVVHFRRWYERQGYRVHELRDVGFFEGNGDALPHPGHGLLWGGVGPRTSHEIYDEVAAITGLTVIRLPLEAPEFYHLDTCFAILSDNVAVVQPKAFSTTALRMIHEVFDHVIDVDYEENLRAFAGNCHSPNGKHVLLQRGARKLVRELERKGFEVIELETGEFMKSGGSVFCLKMQVF